MGGGPIVVEATLEGRGSFPGQEGAFGDAFARSIALSGGTLVVGAPGDDIGALLRAGAAFVFERTGGSWVERAKLQPNVAFGGADFGNAVAVDGDTVWVGAPGYSPSGSDDSGAVFVFERSGSSWPLRAVVRAPNPRPGDRFGASVAASGSRLLVGAPKADIVSGDDLGAAFVFERSGTIWSFRQRLEGAAEDGRSEFGAALALDTDSLAVGAPGADTQFSTDVGVVFAFHFDGTAFVQQGRLRGSGARAASRIGTAVAIVGDELLASAPGGVTSIPGDRGVVHVFARTGSTWTQTDILQDGVVVAGDAFGASLARDGDALAVGVPESVQAPGPRRGAVALFRRSGGQWALEQRLSGNDALATVFGFGTTLALDGGRVVVGAPNAALGGFGNQGAAWSYEDTATGWTSEGRIDLGIGGEDARFGSAAALVGDTLAVGAPVESSDGHERLGAVHLFARGAGGWTRQARIESPATGQYTAFGDSIAGSGDLIAVGAANDAGVRGSAYLIERIGPGWILTAQLAPTDSTGVRGLGASVAVSGDTVAVGAPSSTVGTVANGGRVHVFVRSGASWAEQAALSIPGASVDDRFGSAVALSGDTLLVGAPNRASTSAFASGAVYVFQRVGTTWTQLQELRAPAASSGLGVGSAIALDGDRALVGAPFGTVPGRGPMVHVLSRVGGTWSFQSRLQPSGDAVGTQFGQELALSDRVGVVGAPNEAAVYFFSREGANWRLNERIPGSAGGFGSAVAAFGDFAAVGAPLVNGSPPRGNPLEGRVVVLSGAIAPDAVSVAIAPIAPAPSLLGTPVVVRVDVDGASDAPADGGVEVVASTGERCSAAQGTPSGGTRVRFECALHFTGVGVRQLRATFSGSLTHADAVSVERSHGVITRLVVEPSVLPTGRLLQAYSAVLTAAGSGSRPPYQYFVVGGALPPGLALDTPTGTMTGTPSQPGSFALTIRAVDDSVSVPGGPFIGERSYTLVVDRALQAGLVATATPPTLAPGGTAIIDASGGSGGGVVSFSVESGNAACSINGRIVSGLSTGSCVVRATKAGDAIYESATATVTLRVQNVPVIGSIADQVTLEDLATPTLSFAVNDAESPPDSLVLRATSSDQALVGDTALSSGLGGSGALRTLVVAPQPDANGGPATINLEALDPDGGRATRSFRISVLPVNDPPEVAILGDVVASPAPGAATLTGFARIVRFGPADEQATQGLVGYSVVELSDPDGVLDSASIAANGTLSYVKSGLGGVASLAVTAIDDGGSANGGEPQSSPRTFQLTVPVSTDLDIGMFDGGAGFAAGSAVAYDIFVGNAGPNRVMGARVVDPVPQHLAQAVWTCEPVQLAVCPVASGVGGIDQQVDLPVGGVVRFTLSGVIVGPVGATITNTASILLPPSAVDPQPQNNTASTSALIVAEPALFLDGFEPAQGAGAAAARAPGQ